MAVARTIFLTGFSGSGKSTIAALVSARLGWPMLDTDRIVIEQSGMRIPDIFEREGEAGFRARETEALRSVLHGGPYVIATGGGLPVRAENRQLMAERGWVIHLDTRPEAIHARIQEQLARAHPDAVRPMLGSRDQLEQTRALKYSRQPLYALADWTIHTDRLTADQVADEVVRAAAILAASPITLPPEAPPVTEPDGPVLVMAGDLPYQVVVGWNDLEALGVELRRKLPLAATVAILSDRRSHALYGILIEQAIAKAGFQTVGKTLLPEDAARPIALLPELYEWLDASDVGPHDMILAAGASATDALATLLAATYHAGIALVRLPTTLEGMAGDAVGAVKALSPHSPAIGIRYHPRLVWVDAALLSHWPTRDLRPGWAGVIQRAMLEQSLVPAETITAPLFERLEGQIERLQRLDAAALVPVLRRCLTLQTHVVAAGERPGGPLGMLRFGRVVGEAVQAVMPSLAAGEALAIGMAVETRLAVQRGLADVRVAERLEALLAGFDVPASLPGGAVPALLEYFQHWNERNPEPVVLPHQIGRASLTRLDNAGLLQQVIASYGPKR